MLHAAYFSLGSNLGNRQGLICRAVRMMELRVGTLVRFSRFYETEPVGFSSDNLFLNAAAAFTTSLSAEEILDTTQQIERELGRTQKSEGGIHYDRTVDIDLLLLDDEVKEKPHLSLPHPHLHERRFVLEPLAEIAPGLRHPISRTTVCEMLKALS